MTKRNQARVLIIAGSDSGGGAGIQADIKTVTSLGGYAATAITAVTAQNSLGVQAIHSLPVDLIREQIISVLDDIGADVIKTGMLFSSEVTNMVAALMDERGINEPVIIDPVMVATSGDSLAATNLAESIIENLVPRATLITPNLSEAEALTGLEVVDLDGMRRAAEKLMAMGAGAVLVKGGHLKHDTLHDFYLGDNFEHVFTSKRIDSRNTHGTGCTLASAIACGLAQGQTMIKSIEQAREYVIEAIKQAPNLGQGDGPMGHGFRR